MGRGARFFLSAELKLAKEVADFVVAGSWFQNLMCLGRKNGDGSRQMNGGLGS